MRFDRCPVCGCDERDLEPKDMECGMCYIKCKECGHRGPLGSCKADAIGLWNQLSREYERIIKDELMILAHEAADLDHPDVAFWIKNEIKERSR